MKVIDASAITEILINGNGLRSEIQTAIEGEHLIAPDISPAEVLSALRHSYLKKNIDRDELEDCLTEFLEMSIEAHESTGLLIDTLPHLHNVSAYDALYVALAESLNCQLITVDGRLSRAPGLNCEVISLLP